MPRIYRTEKYRVQKIDRKAVGKPFRGPSDRDAYRRRLKQWSDRVIDDLETEPDADEIPRFMAFLLTLLVGVGTILVILAAIFKW